jgi:acyl-CoA thioester hydrolase
MYNKTDNILSATTEVLALYINLDRRKVSEFENEKIKIIDNYIEENKIYFNTEGLKLSTKLKK